MYCQKCGTKNESEATFCRNCGDVINANSKANKSKKQEVSYESAYSSLFIGLAFLLIAIFLGTQDVASGREWWFWLLIPAAALMAKGIARIMQLQKQEDLHKFAVKHPASTIKAPDSRLAIDERQKELITPVEMTSPYKTGDLVPASVVENTTKLLPNDEKKHTKTHDEE